VDMGERKQFRQSSGCLWYGKRTCSYKRSRDKGKLSNLGRWEW
jgi:hypothetical protein